MWKFAFRTTQISPLPRNTMQNAINSLLLSLVVWQPLDFGSRLPIWPKNFLIELCEMAANWTCNLPVSISRDRRDPMLNSFVCNDPAGNAGKPVFRMVTEMSMWRQCVPRSWRLIQCVGDPMCGSPSKPPNGSVKCNRVLMCHTCVKQVIQAIMCPYVGNCVPGYRYCCEYVKNRWKAPACSGSWPVSITKWDKHVVF